MGSGVSSRGRSNNGTYESNYEGVSRANIPSSWKVIGYGSRPDPERDPEGRKPKPPRYGLEAMTSRIRDAISEAGTREKAMQLAKADAEKNNRTPPLCIAEVDFKTEENAAKNFTDEYDIVAGTVENEPDRPKQLVVRRANLTTIALKFDRDYDKSMDEIIVCFQIGNAPKVSKGTEVRLGITDGLKNRLWGVCIKDIDGDTITLQIQTPPTCYVGKWNFIVDTYNSQQDSDRTVLRYFHNQPMYVLFNAWCKDDPVYLEEEDLLDEYVLNDTGKIYTGNWKQPWGKPWVFGQYEDNVLDCSMWLLDLVKLKHYARGDPVEVVRAISKIVNSEDDDGVLEGNWSGDYSGGIAPTVWSGSDDILQQFYTGRKPVLYGQCWVFSGLCTAVCRALGIPTRSVTNFSSAHDCDANMTIDIHWNKEGEKLDHLNDDSIWNFHVWNEAWMTRPSLATGYGGWQAFDATPQETSGGVYCAGPASVNAIREGNVNLPHDAVFIFAEVNADKLNWIVDDAMMCGSNKQCSKILKNAVGKRISTHKPRKYKRNPDEDDRTYYEKLYNFATKDTNRMDITGLYKFPEGSENERIAMMRARSTYSNSCDVYGMADKDDVQFDMVMEDGILVGSPFDVVIQLQNKSRHQRTINATVTLTAVYYTGVIKGKVKQQTFTTQLESIKTGELRMRISSEEYLHMVVDQIGFRISVLAHVDETNQIFADDDDFRCRRPDLELEVKDEMTIGREEKCKIKLQSSMPINLTQCYWLLQGPGLQKPKKIPQKDLEPFDIVEICVDIKPKKKGKKTLVASFYSKELSDLTGEATIEVSEQ